MKKKLILSVLAIVSVGTAKEQNLAEQCDLPNEPMIVFTAPWCSTCHSLKDSLKAKRIKFLEIDAEASPENATQFDCVGGEYYPFVLLGGEVAPFVAVQTLMD